MLLIEALAATRVHGPTIFAMLLLEVLAATRVHMPTIFATLLLEALAATHVMLLLEAFAATRVMLLEALVATPATSIDRGMMKSAAVNARWSVAPAIALGLTVPKAHSPASRCDLSPELTVS